MGYPCSRASDHVRPHLAAQRAIPRDATVYSRSLSSERVSDLHPLNRDHGWALAPIGPFLRTASVSTVCSGGRQLTTPSRIRQEKARLYNARWTICAWAIVLLAPRPPRNETSPNVGRGQYNRVCPSREGTWFLGVTSSCFVRMLKGYVRNVGLIRFAQTKLLQGVLQNLTLIIDWLDGTQAYRQAISLLCSEKRHARRRFSNPKSSIDPSVPLCYIRVTKQDELDKQKMQYKTMWYHIKEQPPA